jgi:large subunit ribosomal protein L29
MDLKQLKTKSVKELSKLLAEYREKLRDLRFKVSAKQLKNIKEIKGVKKTIARILTLLKETKTQEDLTKENNN